MLVGGRARAFVVAVLAGGLLAGCGVPTGSTTTDPTSAHVTDDGSSTGGSGGGSGGGSAGGDLAAVVVAPDGPATGYDRLGDFGEWSTTAPGCDTRDTVLARDLTATTVRRGCDVTAGTLHSPYSGATLTGPSRSVQIDHRVPLALAWRTGAARWTRTQRVAFANDPLELVAVEGTLNGSKGDSGPESWAPPTGRCRYAHAFVAVLVKYRLTATSARRTALGRMMATCPSG